MASHSYGSQSGDQLEDLEDLIRESEAAIESVTELLQELAGDDWEYLDVTQPQSNTDLTCREIRESETVELTESAHKEQLKLKRELGKEEIEAEFHDLLNSLILELNPVQLDFTENIPVWPPVGQQGLEREDEEKITSTTTRSTTEYLASDAATQTEIKKKSLKCTIL